VEASDMGSDERDSEAEEAERKAVDMGKRSEA